MGGCTESGGEHSGVAELTGLKVVEAAASASAIASTAQQQSSLSPPDLEGFWTVNLSQ